MKAYIRLMGGVCPGRKRSAVSCQQSALSYQPPSKYQFIFIKGSSAVSDRRSVLPYKLPAKLRLISKAQFRIPERKPSAVSSQRAVRPYKLPAKSRLMPKTYHLIPILILVFVSCGAALAQEAVGHTAPAAKAEAITGKVVSSETGEPLEGATLKIRGTNISTVTDANGEFAITQNLVNGILEVSFLGYQKKEIAFSNTTRAILITLEDNLGMLEEVEIHTGFQDIKNERFVGSAATMDSAAYHRRAGMGIVERLDGTVAGVVFNKRSGVVAPLQIRGLSTLGGSDQQTPLIVVDNFPYEGELESINPNDVETITVLKDAAAASIWGTKAGNGVIVITTKRARFEQPLRVNISSNVSLAEKPNLFQFPKMKTSEFIEIERFLFDKGYYDADLANSTFPYSWPVVSPVVELLAHVKVDPTFKGEAETQISEYSKMDVRNELNRYYYQQALKQQHHIGLSGSSTKHAFNFSVGYNQAGSNIKNAKGAHDYTITATNIYKPFERLSLETGVNYGSFHDRSSNNHLPTKMYPYTQLADIDGNPVVVAEKYRLSYAETAGNGALLDWLYRPLEEVKLADDYINRRAVRLNFGISYRPLDWLTAEVKYQYADQRTSLRNHYSIDTWAARDLVNQFTNLNETNIALRYPVPMGGYMRLANGQQFNKNLRAQLKINKNWGLHELNSLIGAEGSESNSFSNGNRLYGYNDEYGTYNTSMNYVTQFPMFWRAASRSLIPNGSSYDEGPLNRSVSFLANATYAYNNKYVFYASARRDGANIFGVATNNKWKPLWSTGASWDIQKEDFFNVNAISSLRLKASYGYTGNVNNRLSGSPTMYYNSILANNLNNLPLAQLSNPPNPHLRWEKVRTINYALDFGFFNDRLAGSIEKFDKKSTDLISQIPFDPTVGVDAFTVNAASLKGNGYELNLKTINTTGHLYWASNFGLAYSKTVVTKVYNGRFMASDFIDYNLHPSVGRLAYGLSSYKWAGLDGQTGDPQGYLDGKISKDYAGIFKDSVDNQVFHGSSIPLYSGFIGNALRWKTLSLSANITYRLGYYFRQPSLSYSSIFATLSLHSDYSERWQEPGDEVKTNVYSMIYPVPSSVSRREEFYMNSEIHVKRGDNIRLQDIRLSYDVPNNFLNTLSIKNLQVYLYANNLNIMIWKAYKGRLDADTSSMNGSSMSVPKVWTMGLTIGI